MIPEQNPDRHAGNPRTAEKQLLIFVINGLGFVGIGLIAYGGLLMFTGEQYRPLEESAEFIANVGTLLGVALTAASVWLPTNTREPEAFSKKYAAPAVVGFVVVVLLLYLFPGILNTVGGWFGATDFAPIPVHIFNGLAVMGLAGALFRLISR